MKSLYVVIAYETEKPEGASVYGPFNTFDAAWEWARNQQKSGEVFTPRKVVAL